MNRLDFSSFNGATLQAVHTLLGMSESDGVTDIRFVRQQIATFMESFAADEFREKREKPPKREVKTKKIDQKPKITNQEIEDRIRKEVSRFKKRMQSHIECPLCHKAYLQLKSGEEGVYVGCPGCYAASLPVFENTEVK